MAVVFSVAIYETLIPPLSSFSLILHSSTLLDYYIFLKIDKEKFHGVVCQTIILYMWTLVFENQHHMKGGYCVVSSNSDTNTCPFSLKHLFTPLLLLPYSSYQTELKVANGRRLFKWTNERVMDLSFPCLWKSEAARNGCCRSVSDHI